jgi:hypothetical protein
MKGRSLYKFLLCLITMMTLKVQSTYLVYVTLTIDTKI